MHLRNFAHHSRLVEICCDLLPMIFTHILQLCLTCIMHYAINKHTIPPNLWSKLKWISYTTGREYRVHKIDIQRVKYHIPRARVTIVA